MMQPGSPQALMPPDESTLMRRVQDLERQVRELVAHNVLRAAGVETAADLFKILGTLQVTGDMLSEGELRVTGDILAEGELRVTGDTVIDGNLSVPNGAIKNDWLESPIEVASAAAWEQNFDITSTTTVFASATIDVPAGYTRAIVALIGTGMGFNNSGASAWLYTAPTLTGAGGGSEVYAGVANGGGVSLVAPHFVVLTDLAPGSSIVASTQMRVSGATWTATTGNVARVDAQVTFLR